MPTTIQFVEEPTTVQFLGDDLSLVFSDVPGPKGEADKRIGGVLLGDPNAGVFIAANSKAVLRIPADLTGMSLVEVGACCTTAGTSGATTIQYRRVRAGASVDMLSTLLTIDANETDSATAATAAVINPANAAVQTADQIHFDITSVSTGSLGVFVSFTFDT